jgi:hypothetical protein
MQKQQALHCNEEAAGAILQCRSSRGYTLMQKQQALHGYAEAAGVKL